MRLACPNCAAIYDVPDEAIPPEGRDVECSNCGHGWFEASARSMAERTEESVRLPRQTLEDEASDDDAEAALMAALNMDDDEAPNPMAPPPRKIDQHVLDVLREEALREREAREKEKRERAKIRMVTPEPASPQFAPEAQALAPNRGEFGQPEAFALGRQKGEPEPASATEGVVARRDLLPDVEEINSSLLADVELPQEAAAAPAARSKALHYGFLFGLVLAGLTGGLYLKAGEISAKWPALAPMIEPYAAWVDDLIDEGAKFLQ